MVSPFGFCWTIWTVSTILGKIVVSENDIFVVPPTIDLPLRQAITLELTLAPQSNFSIPCHARYPITWKPFQGFVGRNEINHIEEEGEYYEDPWSYDRRYISTIHLTNVSHHFVGYFYCVANSTQDNYDDYDYSWRLEVEHEFYYKRNLYSVSGLTNIYIFVDGSFVASSSNWDRF
ncbi:uncharacterized protein LOC119083729 [Bradysia coprophila]|uniref:uncharacterized protein LOC119083729 n=1 Tax=Bradysia coprophila TaxID=38358 RepID=UPI00187D71AA|nr:uncharacterized protein LOC119083729 [Bradysia coprophila]